VPLALISSSSIEGLPGTSSSSSLALAGQYISCYIQKHRAVAPNVTAIIRMEIINKCKQRNHAEGVRRCRPVVMQPP
jgi:hypothetical protein